MTRLHRITQNPDVMGGRPCIRGLRVTVGTVVGLLAAGHDADDVLAAYPYLETDDIRQALAYAAWRSEEQEIAVGSKRPSTGPRQCPRQQASGLGGTCRRDSWRLASP